MDRKWYEFGHIPLLLSKIVLQNWLLFMVIIKALLGIWPMQETIGFVAYSLDFWVANIVFSMTEEKINYTNMLAQTIVFGLSSAVVMMIEMSESRKVYAWFDKQSCKRENLSDFVEFMYTLMTFMATVQPMLILTPFFFHLLSATKNVHD